MTVSKA